MPSKYTKLEESFEGFMNKSLVRFEIEKSPLLTIVYGATGTRKIYFAGQYLKLYLDQEEPSALVGEMAPGLPQQKQKQQQMVKHQGTCFADDLRSIIIICIDEKDWIDPETSKPFAGFELGYKNMITMENINIITMRRKK